MISRNQLKSICKNISEWDAETQQVSTLQALFVDIGGASNIEEQDLDMMRGLFNCAEAYCTPYFPYTKDADIWAVDFEGNCLIDDCTVVKHITELEF